MRKTVRKSRTKPSAATSPEDTGDPGPSTRERILGTAVDLLIEEGVARTTTLQVQQRAGVSRGALLHHFPTHSALLSATVSELVRHNEQAVRESLKDLGGTLDDVERAIRALSVASTRPAYMAELELWAVARNDSPLRAALREAEQRARKDSERVFKALFSCLGDHPATGTVMSLTNEFLRGMALSSTLRSPVRRHQLLTQWIKAVKILLAHSTVLTTIPSPPGSPLRNPRKSPA
jgi:AcrR family transcriptional regulator